MTFGKKLVEQAAEVGLDGIEFGIGDRAGRTIEIADNSPVTLLTLPPPLLTGTTGMSPRSFTAGRCNCDVDALRGASGCFDISCAGYRA